MFFNKAIYLIFDQSKYKQELSALRNQSPPGHSVLHLQDDGRSRRQRAPGSTLASVSRRIGVALTRYPVFRMFMLFYMVRIALGYVFNLVNI